MGGDPSEPDEGKARSDDLTGRMAQPGRPPPEDVVARDEKLRHIAGKLLRRRTNLQAIGAGEPLPPEAVAEAVAGALKSSGGTPTEAIAETAGRYVAEALSAGPRRLTLAEAASLQLIVETVGRPGLRFTDEGLEPPQDDGANERWITLLALRGTAVQTASKAVGAVIKMTSGVPVLIGTAWRAESGRLVTNRHVAQRIAADIGKPPEEWTLWQGGEVWVDFAYFGKVSDQRARIGRLAAVATESWADVAVLEPDGVFPAGPALAIDWDTPVNVGNDIYVVGHPDSRLATPVVASTFGVADGSKRLSPGEVDALLPDGRRFEHDCSTLSGNSGSCALSFDTNRVCGIHFGGVGQDATGAQGRANLCVAATALKGHRIAALL